MNSDEVYREVLLTPLRVCKSYAPVVKGEVVDANRFIALYDADPFYQWMGLASAELFGAHKVAGGITSFYRQLGIGVEHLFQTILIDNLGLTDDDVKWSYIIKEDGKDKRLTLDARIPVLKLTIPDAARLNNWIERVKKMLGITTAGTNGVVFEVRQGYKSADSKRTNADLRNAARAAQDGYLFVVAVMSTQVNPQVLQRWRNNGVLVLTGELGKDETESIFAFSKIVLGFDLASFFIRNSEILANEVKSILNGLLST